MASYVREKLTGSSSDDSDDKDKYHISVSASTSYEDGSSKQIVINGPPRAVSDSCKVAVRIKEYQGIPLDSPKTSSYFEDSAHAKDTYSVAVSWMPRVDISAEDLVWGIELVNPIRDHIPKRFINTAFSIVKEFIDPSLRCDPYADKPWLNGPVLCSSAITFSIGSDQLSTPETLTEGGIPADSPIRTSLSVPAAENKRRKHFMDAKNREAFVFEKGRCYAFDFHNGYIDWRNYALKLPGFSLGVLKYIDERTHTLRFVLKDRRSGELFVATTFRLLFGEELEKAISEDEKRKANEPSGVGGTSKEHESRGAKSGSKESETARAGSGTANKNRTPDDLAGCGNDGHVSFADHGADENININADEKSEPLRDSRGEEQEWHSGSAKQGTHASSSSPGATLKEAKAEEEEREKEEEELERKRNPNKEPTALRTNAQRDLPEESSELGAVDKSQKDATTASDDGATTTTTITTTTTTKGETGFEGGGQEGQTTGLRIDWGAGEEASTGAASGMGMAGAPETAAARGSIEESLLATATKDGRV